MIFNWVAERNEKVEATKLADNPENVAGGKSDNHFWNETEVRYLALNLFWLYIIPLLSIRIMLEWMYTSILILYSIGFKETEDGLY